MPKLRSSLVIVAVILAPLIVIGVFTGPSVLDLLIHRRPPNIYIVPDGFHGWAHIDLRRPDASPLPVENGRLIFRLDAHGTLATSDGPREGHAHDEFFAATPTGLQPLRYVGVCKGGEVWGLETLTNETTHTPYIRFFVGTEGQYRHDVDPSGKNFPSC